MEGLMNFQANSAGAVSKQQQNSVLVPAFSPKVTTNTRISLQRIGMVRNSKLFNSFVASVQPLEAFAVTPFDNTLPSKEVLDVWQNANAVCFDVDSTVCIDEGIDEFAEFCGAGKAVAEWTARAMNGSVPFEEALAARLSLINPSLKQLQDFLKRPPRLSPGIDLLVKNLKDKNKDVYLVSGGFRQMINPVASILGIPLENIFANQILFGSNGEYVGFDKNEPTSRRGGKATAVQQIRKAHGYKSLVMIGDGATDLEILPFSPIFVAGSYARWCGLVCLLRRNSTTRISCS
ncbi:phosphoserine phosphatase, chloroplastic isoform X2 [Capsicum annuum]|uniref:phosphoserine phosphatase, chloroplastic isoform X2 n=1 Tax=Capsicum annuum TaxID=4072 RepID=UPI001FB06B05|nr:phosphoserine phosphatase, chloroplastic isoform X2 [Capsicum annuum]